MRKKLMTGAAVLALLMSAPQVSADDDVVIFGSEFEEEATTPAPKKVKKPAPVKELPPPPVEKPEPPPKPEVVEPQDTPPTQPIENPDDLPANAPPEEPVSLPEDDDEDLGDKLVFDDLSKLPQTQPIEQPPAQKVEPLPQPIVEPPTEIDRPFEQPKPVVPKPVIIIPPTPEPIVNEPPTILREIEPSQPAEKQKPLKMLKPRFVKLAADDRYTYYLDKNAVQWKKMPYSASEYIADVWIRMIERSPAQLDKDMAAYGAENFNAEIDLAREQGYQYPPEDIYVLSNQGYVLEHYYLRPKTNQIQFLCELEVFGRPQNTVRERVYDYKNWENLVPDSVESVIYTTVLKTIGTKKASERGHMSFIDMLEEYGRISLR